MAITNTFDRYTKKDVSTTGSTMLPAAVAASTTLTALGLIVSNKHNAPITVKVSLDDGTNEFYLIYNTTIPVGESLVTIGWDQKLVLKTGDNVKVYSSVASAADAVLSVLKTVTT